MFSLVLKNTSFQFLSRASTTFVGFLITVLIARYFGPNQYGDFTKIVTVVGIFYLILDFGLNANFLHHFSEKDAFKSLFYLRLLTSLIIFLVILSSYLILPEKLTPGFTQGVKLGIIFFSLTMFGQTLLLSCSAIFQKKLEYSKLFVSQFLGSVLNLLLVFIFISRGFPLSFILFSFVLSSLLSGGIAIFQAHEKLLPPSLTISKKLIIESAPLGLMLIFNLIYFRVDILILSIFKPSFDVGIYGLSYRFFDFLIALPLFLSNSLYPILLDNLKNVRMFREIVKKFFFFFLGGAILMVGVFWFVSPLFSLISSNFVPAIIPFRILLLGLPVFFLSSFFQWILIAFKDQKFLMLVYLGAALLNVFLNFIFIPKGSYIAAAIITGLTEALVLVLLIYRINQMNFIRRDHTK